jgi:hypothetical protein
MKPLRGWEFDEIEGKIIINEKRYSYYDFFKRINIKIRLIMPKGVQTIPMYFKILLSAINPTTIKTIPIKRNMMGWDRRPIFCSLFMLPKSSFFTFLY